MEKKILIIGGGTAGLAALNAFIKYGYKEVMLLEKEAAIGGIWHTTKYPNLHLHSKSFNYRFIDFHPIQSQKENASREEVLAYLNDFIEKRHLSPYIKFKMRVDKIEYHENATQKKCVVYITNLSNSQSSKIECDYVICALGFSSAGNPHLPQFPGEDSFTGKILHSSEFTNGLLEDIIQHNKKAVVLGAGKSGQDILQLFANHIENVVWVFKKSLWCVSYEKIYGKNLSLRPLQIYLLFVSALGRKFKHFPWFLYLLQRPIVWSNLLINPVESHTDIRQSRASILKKDHFVNLKKIKNIKTEIVRLEGNQVILKNNQVITADYLICATGYERGTNLPPIQMIDAKGNARPYHPNSQHSFFRNIIDPNMPEIALFTADLIFPQQLFGSSLAAEWLVQFYEGKLTKHYSIEDIKSDIAKNRSHHQSWSQEGEYQSKGMPYFYTSNAIKMLPQILNDLGIKKSFATKLMSHIGNPDIFDTLITQMNQVIS